MTRQTREALNAMALGAVLAWVVPMAIAVAIGFVQEWWTGRASW